MNKKHLKILLFLGLAISGSFSGAFLDKFNIKEKIVEIRNNIKDYFNNDVTPQSQIKTDIPKDTETQKESFWAKIVGEKEVGKLEEKQSFDNLQQYQPVKSLPAVSNYCHGFLAYGNPSYDATDSLAKSDMYLCRDGYVVGYNYQTKQPAWVAFRLTKSKVANRYDRNDSFREDTDIPYVYRATLSDYKKSGYDRGHLASYASMDFSKKSAYESFLMSNMSPQKPALNRQGWERLETYERVWANMYDSVYIYTGPIYKKKKVYKTIGSNGVAVPDYYYKIIYVPSEDKAIAFVMPNSKVNKGDVSKYRESINHIEERTGLHFLSNINDRGTVVDKVPNMWRTAYK